MPAPFQGVGDFVAALTGGGAIREDARFKREGELIQQDTARARMDKAIAEAMMDRQRAMSYEKLRGMDFSSLGINPDQGAVLGELLSAGGGNAQALTGGVGNLFETARRAAVVQEAGAGNMGAANANLLALANGPVSPVDVDSGYIVADRFSDAPTVSPTDEVMARTAATQALAGNREAQAGAALARAALANRTDPNRPRGGKATTIPATAGTPQVTIDPSVPAVIAADIAANPQKWETASAAPARSFTQDEALQALRDAREAVKRGMPVQQAKQRLVDAGLDNIAGRL